MLRDPRYAMLLLLVCFVYFCLLVIGVALNDYSQLEEEGASNYGVMLLITIASCLPLLILDHIAHFYAFRSLYLKHTGTVVDFLVSLGSLALSVMMYRSIQDEERQRKWNA